jgi:hypothetical protein
MGLSIAALAALSLLSALALLNAAQAQGWPAADGRVSRPAVQS